MTPDTKDATEGKTGVKRRDFLKVLSVTGAATAAVGCASGDVEKLIPYLVSPDNTVPGVSNYYATTCRECAAGCGLIVEVRDGRAIKAEGNPEHPVNRGALCARGQSGLQGLYNPDRFRGPMKREGDKLVPTTWTEAMQTLAQKLGEVKSKGSGQQRRRHQPARAGQRSRAFLDSVIGGLRHRAASSAYDAEAPIAVARGQSSAAYGTSVAASSIFAAASLIVSFSADFLDGWGRAGAAAARVCRSARQGGRRTALHLCGCASLAHWFERRSVDSGPPGHGARNCERAARSRLALPLPQKPLALAPALHRRSRAMRFATHRGRQRTHQRWTTAKNAYDLAAAVAELNKQRGNIGKTIDPSRRLARV